mmetsp:Transcript_1961/g.4332  ORF Transcript_1961/g.4332 Transcript_1961/m.4332 type:complete len:209 (+) Transcript_1961:3-629(+)
MPILRGEPWPLRGIGWMYDRPRAEASNGYGYRYGRWKLSVGGVSCREKGCRKPQLYDMEVDIAERHDLSAVYPDILAQIHAKFTHWFDSVQHSIANESRCSGHHAAPSPTPLAQAAPSSACTFHPGTALAGDNLASGHVGSKEACCGACAAHGGCVAAEFVEATAVHPSWDGESSGGTCHLKAGFDPRAEQQGRRQIACRQLARLLSI